MREAVPESLVAALDVGAGSGTKAALLDGSLLSLADGFLPATEYGTDPEGFFDRLAALVRRMANSAGRRNIAALGIACPGLFRSDGSFRPITRLPFLNGVRIEPAMERRLACPVLCGNDADVGAHGEWTTLRDAMLYWVFGGGWGGAWVSARGGILHPGTDWDGSDEHLHYSNEPGYAIPLARSELRGVFKRIGGSYSVFEEYRATGQAEGAAADLACPTGHPDCIRAEAVLSGPGRWHLFRMFAQRYPEFIDTLSHSDRNAVKDPVRAGPVITRLGDEGEGVAVRTDILFGRVLALAGRRLLECVESEGLPRRAPIRVAGGVAGALHRFGPHAQRAMRSTHRLQPSVLAQQSRNPNLVGAGALALSAEQQGSS